MDPLSVRHPAICSWVVFALAALAIDELAGHQFGLLGAFCLLMFMSLDNWCGYASGYQQAVMDYGEVQE